MAMKARSENINLHQYLSTPMRGLHATPMVVSLKTRLSSTTCLSIRWKQNSHFLTTVGVVVILVFSIISFSPCRSCHCLQLFVSGFQLPFVSTTATFSKTPRPEIDVLQSKRQERLKNHNTVLSAFTQNSQSACRSSLSHHRCNIRKVRSRFSQNDRQTMLPSMTRSLRISSSSSSSLIGPMFLSTRSRDASAALREIRSGLMNGSGVGTNPDGTSTGNDDAELILQALRGTNLNDNDTALRGMQMQLVDVGRSKNKQPGSTATDMDSGSLPLVYDPVALKKFFSKRPGAILTRIIQLTSSGGGYVGQLLLDRLVMTIKKQKKMDPDLEVRRAGELRDLLTSLGPFYIKIGQALSIRPDILSPRSMVELQQLCDKVPSFDSKIAFQTIYDELNRPVAELFTEITPEPVAAASLGQVYKAVLFDEKTGTNQTVAVKVQRPGVLETVSLDLYLVREVGLFLRKFPMLVQRLDPVSLLDEFAYRFYQELDYNLECANGIRMEHDMSCLKPMVVIPKNYPQYTTRRVHTAQWIDGEKLSQSTANDVSSLVNLGVITYLTQLLDSGFFHADPHPGNMLRTTDGKLAIIDFGLMTEITDDQKYGMVEAIAHLINRDYSEIGQDFINLDFIPKGTDTRSIVPALTKVFDVALAGGGAKSINFQELAADLAEITFEYPFRIPPYFALVIRAISVLEGIALVGNPNFAIIDEAYPYIARRLMTDRSPRLRAALRYMIYGKDGTFDAENVIDLLQALEKFTAVRYDGDGSAFKVDGVRGNKDVGTAGDFTGSQKVDLSDRADADERFRLNNPSSISSSISSITSSSSSGRNGISIDRGGELAPASRVLEGAGVVAETTNDERTVREALRFFFSPTEGEVFREFMLEEIVAVVDASSRQAVQELVQSLGLGNVPVPSFIRALNPEISDRDRRMVQQITKLVQFMVDGTGNSGTDDSTLATTVRLRKLIPVVREFSPQLRDFGILLAARLSEKAISRGLVWASNALQDMDPNSKRKRTFEQSALIRR